MGVESKSYEPTPEDKAKDLLKKVNEGDFLSLYDTMQELGDDPSASGRTNFIKEHEGEFIELFNENLQPGAAPLDASRNNYGYSLSGPQNNTYLRAYLKLKSGEVREVSSVDDEMPAEDYEDPNDYSAFIPERETLSVHGDIHVEEILRTEDLAYRIAESNVGLDALTKAYPLAIRSMTRNLEEGFRKAGVEPTETGAESVSSVRLQDGVAEMYDGDGGLICAVDLFPDSFVDERTREDEDVVQQRLVDAYGEAARSSVRGGEEVPGASADDFRDALYDEDDGVEIAGVDEEDLNGDQLPEYGTEFNDELVRNPSDVSGGGWRGSGTEEDGVVDFAEDFVDDEGEDADYILDKKGRPVGDADVASRETELSDRTLAARQFTHGEGGAYDYSSSDDNDSRLASAEANPDDGYSAVEDSDVDEDKNTDGI